MCEVSGASCARRCESTGQARWPTWTATGSFFALHHGRNATRQRTSNSFGSVWRRPILRQCTTVKPILRQHPYAAQNVIEYQELVREPSGASHSFTATLLQPTCEHG